MSDNAPATLTIYGVEGKENDIAQLLSDESFGTVWGEYSTSADQVLNGETYVSDEADIRSIDSLGTAFEGLGLSYVISQDAKYEYDGIIYMYTPELGTFVGTANQTGTVTVSAPTLVEKVLRPLDEAVQIEEGYEGYEEVVFFNSETVIEATTALEDLVGFKWTRALDKLAESAKA